MKDSPITPRPGKAPGAERPSRMSVVIAVVMSCVAAVLAWAFISAVVRTEAGGDVVTILGASITLASLVWPDVRKSRNKKYEAQKQDISVLSRAHDYGNALDLRWRRRGQQVRRGGPCQGSQLRSLPRLPARGSALGVERAEGAEIEEDGPRLGPSLGARPGRGHI